MSGTKREMVRCRGLVTNPNELAAAGDGAMRTFTNWLLTRPDLMQSRRGVTRLNGTANSVSINKLVNYDAGLVFQSGTGGSALLKRIDTSTGAITSYGVAVAPNSGKRMRSCIASKNLYIAGTTPWRLSGLTGTPVAAGMPHAPGFDRSATAYPAGTMLLTGYGAAYRYLFGFVDDKGNRHIGRPSGRLVANNTSGATADVTLRATVPSGATANHFIQYFRSTIVANGTQPDDDLQLVFEKQLKALDLTNGYTDLTDVVPENLRGEFIYTAPNGGEGWDEANISPPATYDLCAHKDRVWYAGSRSIPEFILQILAVGGSAGIQNSDTIKFTGQSPFSMTATTGAVGAGQYGLVTAGTALANIEQTALNLVSSFNKYASNTEFWAEYLSGADDIPGRILFRRRTAGGANFTVSAGASSLRSCFAPQLTPDLSAVTWSLTRTLGTTVTATISSGTHALAVGEQAQMTSAGDANFAAGTFTITAVTGTTFVYAQSGANVTSAGHTFALSPDDIATSEMESLTNRVYYSKPLEPEATTKFGYVDCGTPDTDILALVPQRGQIWVWKEREIGRIVGDDPESFRYEVLDASINVRSTESILPFAQRCWGLTDRGIVAVSESGLEEMSRNIASDVRGVLANATIAANAPIEANAFAVAYESEHLYMLFYPGDRDTANGYGACRNAFVWQDQTETWSLWDFASANGKRCAVVCVEDDRLYFGDQYAGIASDSFIYKERKALTAADLTDTNGAGTDAGIAKTATWLLQTQQSPGRIKRWDELEFLFVSGQADFSVALANEINSVSTFTLASQSSQTARLWPHLEVARGTRLLVTVTHSVTAEALALAGLVVGAEVLDGATTR